MKVLPLAIWAGGPMSIPQALLIALLGMIIVLAELALIAIFILILSKIMQALTKKESTENSDAAVTDSSAPAVAGSPLPNNQSAGSLNLENVDEKTAAVIMAIVSNESGIPLNRLAFKSIKLVEDK
jgi:oxaloacetate decarboxylase (Na+ extruding) subunit gamma